MYNKTQTSQFTVEDGLSVQREQLARWKKVLKEDCFKCLAYHCEALNMQLESGTLKDVFGNIMPYNGYSVFRGQNIDTFVFNNLMGR